MSPPPPPPHFLIFCVRFRGSHLGYNEPWMSISKHESELDTVRCNGRTMTVFVLVLFVPGNLWDCSLTTASRATATTTSTRHVPFCRQRNYSTGSESTPCLLSADRIISIVQCVHSPATKLRNVTSRILGRISPQRIMLRSDCAG